jgi:hypothetical protein
MRFTLAHQVPIRGEDVIASIANDRTDLQRTSGNDAAPQARPLYAEAMITQRWVREKIREVRALTSFFEAQRMFVSR